MLFSHRNVNAIEYVDSYRDYFEILRDNNIGPTITEQASAFLAPGGVVDQMADATTMRELVEAINPVREFMLRTRELAEHFALRDIVGNRAYAFIDALRGFEGLVFAVTTPVDEEAAHYLAAHKEEPALFDTLPLITDFEPKAGLPTHGDIEIMFAEAGSEIAGDPLSLFNQAKETARKAEDILAETDGFVFTQDCPEIGIAREPFRVVFRGAAHKTFCVLRANAQRLGVKESNILWKKPQPRVPSVA